MRATQETQGASETLQGEIHKQNSKTETQEQKEDKLRASPTRHRSSVHFFSKKIDSQPMTLPMSQSVSSGMSLSYYLSSKVTLSTGPPLTSKSTVMSSSQTDNMLGNSSMLLSKNQIFDPESSVAGDGEDYFLSLFGDPKKLIARSTYAKDPNKHFSAILEEVGKSISSALADIKIAEVDVKGLFVKLTNSSPDKEVEIGNCSLQQNVKGQALSLYRFPPNVVMQADSTVTVWAGASNGKHQPPSDFLWKEQNMFRTSPNCTTILCRPNGEAVAWYTPIHWKQVWEKLGTDIEFHRRSVVMPTFRKHMVLWTTSASTISEGKQDQAKEDTSKCDLKQAQILRREKEAPPTLLPNRSPWCSSPCTPGHPYCSLINHDGCTTPGSSSQPQHGAQSPRADQPQLP